MAMVTGRREKPYELSEVSGSPVPFLQEFLGPG